jgi:hypothetical protein
MLLFVMIKDNRTILGSGIIALPVEGGGIMGGKEDLK